MPFPTPEEQNAALAAMGSEYRVPVPQVPAPSPFALPMGGAVQPLTAEEMAIGAELGRQAAAADAQAALQGFEHGNTNPAAAPARPGPASLDWQPPTPPGALVRPPSVTPFAPAPRPDARPDATVPAVPSPAPRRGGGGGGGALPRVLDTMAAGHLGTAMEATQAANDAELDAMMSGTMRDDAIRRGAQTKQDLAERDRRAQDAYNQAADQFAFRERHRAEMFAEAERRTQAKLAAEEEFIANYEPTDRRTKGQHALSAVAIALGSIGQGLQQMGGIQGARNTALDVINDAIERDYRAQKDLLDNKKTAAAAARSDLARQREQFSDDQDRERELFQMTQRQKYIDAIQQSKGQGMADEAVAAADQLIASLANENATAREARNLSIAEKHFSEAENQVLQATQVREAARRAAAAANRPMSAKEALDLEGKALDNEKKRRELGGAGAPDKETIARVEAQDRVLALIDKISQVRADNPVERGMPGFLPGVQAPATLEALGAQLDLELKEAKKLGALDKGSLEVLEQMRGNPATWGRDADAKLAEIRKSAIATRAQLTGQPDLTAKTRPLGGKR